jgi:hypothetical protein
LPYKSVALAHFIAPLCVIFFLTQRRKVRRVAGIYFAPLRLCVTFFFLQIRYNRQILTCLGMLIKYAKRCQLIIYTLHCCKFTLFRVNVIPYPKNKLMGLVTGVGKLGAKLG